MIHLLKYLMCHSVRMSIIKFYIYGLALDMMCAKLVTAYLFTTVLCKTVYVCLCSYARHDVIALPIQHVYVHMSWHVCRPSMQYDHLHMQSMMWQHVNLAMHLKYMLHILHSFCMVPSIQACLPAYISLISDETVTVQLFTQLLYIASILGV